MKIGQGGEIEGDRSKLVGESLHVFEHTVVFVFGTEVFDDERHVRVASVGELHVVSQIKGAIAGGDLLEVEGQVAFKTDVFHVTATDVGTENAEAFVKKVAVEKIALGAIDHIDDVEVH